MVWKQDLVKLKQQLKEEEGVLPAARPLPPKKVEKPTENRSLEDEDALFLLSMGQRPAPPPLPAAAGKARIPVTPFDPKPTADSASFVVAMSDLKGFKPIEGHGVPPPLPVPAAAAPSVPLTPAKPEVLLPKVPLVSEVLEASEETRPLNAPPPAPGLLKPKGPVLIQLAAGMAIEVDGFLDLRNHTLSDARERIKERLEDSLLLGWRSLHIILGPSEALKQGFLAFLTTPSARTVQRYAQAPVPMGGSQAWILYVGTGQP